MLDIEHFRNLYNKLGRRELISLLENHFLDEYKLENKTTPRFTKIRGDTRVLVDAKTAGLHFRIIMRAMWTDLRELFPCLPDEYSSVDLEMYSMVASVQWNRTFSQVANIMWKYIRQICTSCLGKDKTCDVGEISNMLITLTRECNGDNACISRNIPKRDMWRVLGLLGLSVPVAEGFFSNGGGNVHNSHGLVQQVSIVPSVQQPTHEDGVVRTTNSGLVTVSRTTLETRQTQERNREEINQISTDFVSTMTSRYGSDFSTLGKHLGSSQLITRGPTGSNDVIESIKSGLTRYARHEVDNSENIAWLNISASKIAEKLADATGVVISTQVNGDREVIVHQIIYRTDDGEVRIVTSESDKVLLKDITDLMGGLVTESAQGQFEQLQTILNVVGRNKLPPIIAYGFNMDEEQQSSGIKDKRDDVSVAIILVDKENDTESDVLEYITAVQEFAGESAKHRSTNLVGVDGDLAMEDIGSQVGQNFRVIGNEGDIEGAEGPAEDAKKKGTIEMIESILTADGTTFEENDNQISMKFNGKTFSGLETIRRDLAVEYTDIFRATMRGENMNMQRKLLAIVVANKDNPNTLDMAAQVDLMHTTFSTVLGSFTSGKREGIDGKFGADIYKSYDALVEARDFLTKDQFDEKYEEFALDLYRISSDIYVDNVLEKMGFKRENLEEAMAKKEVMEEVDAMVKGDDWTSPLTTYAAWTRVKMENSIGKPRAILEVIGLWATGGAQGVISIAESTARFFGSSLPMLYKQDQSLQDAVTFAKDYGINDPLDMTNVSPDNIWFIATIVKNVNSSSTANFFQLQWPIFLQLLKVVLFFTHRAKSPSEFFRPKSWAGVAINVFNFDLNLTGYGFSLMSGFVTVMAQRIYDKSGAKRIIDGDENNFSLKARVMMRIKSLFSRVNEQDDEM